MKKLILLVVGVFLSLLFVQCGGNETKEKTSENEKTSVKTGDKQLNITFLLDLSDRIDPEKYPNSPEHYQRDIAIVNEFVNIFKADMESKGGHKAKGKMKVLFSPQPQDANINKIAQELNIDLSSTQVKNKKDIFENISTSFVKNLESIYQLTLQNKNFIGSDVWRFFKNDVKDYAIDANPDYRNILVILTDGYIYHENSKSIQNNRSSYLVPSFIKAKGLTGNNWKEKFDNGDFGYISTRQDLENLEVLVLEVNPSKNSLSDEDLIKAYFEKWFKEMNVKKFNIYNSDLPNNTKTRIENFLKS